MNFQEELKTQESAIVSATVSTGTKPMEITPEYILSQIVNLFNMLNNINAVKGKRESIRGICNTLSNISMPKSTGTQLRQELEELGFVGGANGSISTFKNLEQYRSLIQYAIFSEDSYRVPLLDKINMNPTELKLYKEATKMEEALPKESVWQKRLGELNLSIPPVYHPDNITIIGEPLFDIEERKIDLPEVTDYLPEGASLIRYHNTAYLYVTTPCILELTLKKLLLMDIDITPIFYQTFEGGTSLVDHKAFPPCEDLPEGVHFEIFPDHEIALAITTTEAYISLIEKGIYQRYNTIDEWNDYSIHVNYYFLPSVFDSLTPHELTVIFKDRTLPVICALDNIEILEYIRKDLLSITTVDAEEIIVTALDERLGQLNSVA